MKKFAVSMYLAIVTIMIYALPVLASDGGGGGW